MGREPGRSVLVVAATRKVQKDSFKNTLLNSCVEAVYEWKPVCHASKRVGIHL